MKIDMSEVAHISETSLTIRGTRRRTTVPKFIVEKMGLNDGEKIRWILFKDGRLAVSKVEAD